MNPSSSVRFNWLLCTYYLKSRTYYGNKSLKSFLNLWYSRWSAEQQYKNRTVFFKDWRFIDQFDAKLNILYYPFQLHTRKELQLLKWYIYGPGKMKRKNLISYFFMSFFPKSEIMETGIIIQWGLLAVKLSFSPFKNRIERVK